MSSMPDQGGARRVLGAERRSRLSPAQRILLEQRLDASLAPAPGSGAFRLRTGQEPVPLSFAQERLWFLDQLEPGNLAYNRPVALRLTGHLDLTALERALSEIVCRHEVLRSTFFSVNGYPAQVINPVRRIRMPLVDLGRLPQPEREPEARRLAREEAQRPFDLSEGPLLRATLLSLAGEEHVLILVMHHIAFDGWSAQVLVRELAVLYDAFLLGGNSPLPELPIQYADFTQWQRERLQGAHLDRQLSYWLQKLEGAPSSPELVTDRLRPPQSSHRGAIHPFVLSESLSQSIQAFSRSENVTLFVALLAAWKVLLHCYTAEDDIVVGSPVAGRTSVETETLVGLFTNTLVLRTDLSGDPSFRRLMSRVKKTVLEALDHQELPFERLVQELNPVRDPSRQPLYQVVFNLRNHPRASAGASETASLHIEEFDFDDGIAQRDLALEIAPGPEGLCCLLRYNTDLFDRSTIRRMASCYRELLDSARSDPDQPVSHLRLMTDAERYQVLVQWNQTKADYPDDRCLHQLFEAQVERTPYTTALVHRDEKLTFRQLNSRANQLAQRLQALGIGPEMLVAICVERSVEMIVGLLGILKAGGAYVPLDPAYPKERLSLILDDIRAPVLLTQERLLPNLPEHSAHVVLIDALNKEPISEHQGNPDSPVMPENLAYVIYTSGTTGKPKGVMIQHRSVANLVDAARRYHALVPGDRVLLFNSFTFDASVCHIFSTLAWGATLVLRTEAMIESVPAFLEKCSEWGVNHLRLPTVFWQELGSYLASHGLTVPDHVRLVTAGGEQMRAPEVVAWLEHLFPGTRLFNAYGPTEATVRTTCCELSTTSPEDWDSRSVPIGRPISNYQTYILDRHMQPVPIGVPGELYIGGVGLARGYLNSPGQTAVKFLPNPFGLEPGARLYATGDRTRYLPDGSIEFLGRVDQQVKIRGFRVEPGEIATALRDHSVVRDAVVLANEDATGGSRLVAYVVPDQVQRLADRELCDYLKNKLPYYMVPSAFVILDALPLLPSGKLDRRALPSPDWERPQASEAYVAPRDLFEEQLLAIWAEVLGVASHGIRDSFFDLGGHSMLAIRLMARVNEAYNSDLPLAALFQAPTVEQMADLLRSEQRPNVATLSTLVALQSGGSRPPVFMAPGNMGNVFTHLGALARYLGPDQPSYGLQDSTQNPVRITSLAARYAKAIRSVQPEAPYFLVGVCYGAAVALEIAQQLQSQGQRVPLLALVEPSRLRTPGLRSYSEFGSLILCQFARRFGRNARRLSRAPAADWKEFLGMRLKLVANSWAAIHYDPQPFEGRMSLFLTRETLEASDDRRLDWRTLALRGAQIHEIPGGHAEIVGADERPIDEAAMRDLARRLRAIIDNELGYG